VAFWSTEKLEAELPLMISEFVLARVKHGAYELSLGPEVVVSGNEMKTRLEEHEQVAIPAGQFAHLLTEEVVTVPLDAIAFISIKTSVKKTGLINVSGFHVDSGFRGRLIFSVYNAGVRAVVLTRLDPTFLIWFADLDNPTRKPYKGEHQGQTELTGADTMTLQGSLSSPPAVAIRLEALEGRVSRWFATIRWIALALLSTVIAVTVRECYPDLRSVRPSSDVGQESNSQAQLSDSTLVPKRGPSEKTIPRGK
jgi:dCTP deaminase